MKDREPGPHPMDVMTGRGAPGRVLVVDDDPSVAATYGMVLRRAGYQVDVLSDPIEALARITATAYDSILSDIGMPRLNGLDLLRLVKERNLDIPVVLMTEGPRLETAIRAIEFGAAHYLVKPVAPAELERALGRAVLFHRLGRLKRLAQGAPSAEALHVTEDDELEERFANALDTLWPAFQPIVSWKDRSVYAYEALLRAKEPSLPSPADVIGAAERLDALPVLGRAMRHCTAVAAKALPRDALLFLNLHPQDFCDDDLYATDTPLAAIAERVVLEITERASLDNLPDLGERFARLRRLGYRLAIDDLGAGYAGLSSVVHVQPEVVKIDMSLVRDVDAAGPRQQVIRSLARLCNELGMTVICEGVETGGERDTLASFDCDLMQGYLFGRPLPGFSAPRF